MRVAIFGGTFDPIHAAHLRVAREAADAFRLDRVLFITAGNPPHKAAGSTTPYEHRHRMVEIACQADPRFEASRLEEGEQKSYSVDTIRKVRSLLQPDDDLYFLIGADAFAEIGSWRRAEEVLATVPFIVVSRPGYRYPVPEGARVERLESVTLPVSSSSIRKQIEAGAWETLRGELPAAVAGYIRSHRLYQNA